MRVESQRKTAKRLIKVAKKFPTLYSREDVIEYLKTLKEVTDHTNADESDEIETAKLIETKAK